MRIVELERKSLLDSIAGGNRADGDALPDRLLRQLRERRLDLSLAPQWSLLSALSGGLEQELHGIALLDGQEPVACASYLVGTRRQYGVPLRVRELPGNRLVCYHGELAAADRIAGLLAALVGAGPPECDLLYLPEILRDSPTDRAIREAVRAHRWQWQALPSARSPYLPIAGSWQAFMEGRSSSFRYLLRRKQRALERLGATTERWFEQESSIPELLRAIAEIEEGSWKVDAAMAISRSRRETAYYELLLPWLARLGTLSAVVVQVGDAPVAYSLCYVWCGRMAQMKTSFKESHAEASPGLTATAASIRRAHELGLAEFDFLGDVMPHKTQWTALLRPHDHHYVYPRTLRGRLVGGLKRVARRLRGVRQPETIGRGGRLARD